MQYDTMTHILINFALVQFYRYSCHNKYKWVVNDLLSNLNELKLHIWPSVVWKNWNSQCSGLHPVTIRVGNGFFSYCFGTGKLAKMIKQSTKSLEATLGLVKWSVFNESNYKITLPFYHSSLNRWKYFCFPTLVTMLAILYSFYFNLWFYI